MKPKSFFPSCEDSFSNPVSKEKRNIYIYIYMNLVAQKKQKNKPEVPLKGVATSNGDASFCAFFHNVDFV